MEYCAHGFPSIISFIHIMICEVVIVISVVQGHTVSGGAEIQNHGLGALGWLGR